MKISLKQPTMAATTTTGAFILIIAITFFSAVAAATEAPSSSPPVLTCTDELVMFSPCLPYVSDPPNNMSETPNPLCCTVFSSSVNSSAGNCLCYLLRQPMILGFPLDRSRLLSLSRICTDRSSDESFESLCSPSESPDLPPLQSIQFTNPFFSADIPVSASPQSLGLAPETAGIYTGSNQSPPDTATLSPPLSQLISTGSPILIHFCFLLTIITTLATCII